ncbi:MAG: hypothetical protein F4Z31_02185 [Gemmatimonadetes bacterium]|nr:hypothetical protein [Gemmatimonadota bacterium]
MWFFGLLVVLVGLPLMMGLIAEHTQSAEERLAAEALQAEHDAGLIDFTPTEAQNFARALEMIDSWESGTGETMFATEQYRPRLHGSRKDRVVACLLDRPRCEAAAGRWEQAVIEAMVEADRRELDRRSNDEPPP